MYVGVIRGDMPGPVFLADLEPTSQTNFPTEPAGQTQYVTRPNATTLTNFLAGLDANDDPAKYQGSGGVPAGVESTSAITFPVTLTSGNNTLKLNFVSAGSYSTFTIATGVYSTMASLLAAVNKAIGTAAATAVADATGTLLVIQSTALGVGAYIGYNSTGGGSTFNTPANFNAGATNFTMPSATTIITNLLPVGGPLNVSPSQVATYLGAAPAAASAVNLIAPQLVETTDVIQSFQVGNMSKYLEASYNPDPRLLPALANGPALQVVQNDGVSAYVAPLPIITGAVHNSPNTGDITITGSDLGNSEFFTGTIVRVTSGATPKAGVTQPFVELSQKRITSTLTGGTQGVVSATSIVIPASLLSYSPGGNPFPAVTPPAGVALGIAGSLVEIKFTTLANTNYGTAATISAVTNPGGTVTLTGLARMQANMVGEQLTLTGCATAANNGTFFISAYVSSTSVKITNLYAQHPDANSGAIAWSMPYVAFVVT